MIKKQRILKEHVLKVHKPGECSIDNFLQTLNTINKLTLIKIVKLKSKQISRRIEKIKNIIFQRLSFFNNALREDRD